MCARILSYYARVDTKNIFLILSVLMLLEKKNIYTFWADFYAYSVAWSVILCKLLMKIKNKLFIVFNTTQMVARSYRYSLSSRGSDYFQIFLIIVIHLLFITISCEGSYNTSKQTLFIIPKVLPSFTQSRKNIRMAKFYARFFSFYNLERVLSGRLPSCDF